MKIISRKIIKNTTPGGYYAKQYIYLVDYHGEYLLHVKKYLLSSIDKNIINADMMRVYRDKKLTLEVFSMKVDTILDISNWINTILTVEDAKNNIHNTKS